MQTVTVEVTAATFTRRRINGIYGCTRCVCNLSKSGMHGCTHRYYTIIQYVYSITHVDFYTQKIVFENTVNISQNERLSQSQHPRNIAFNYMCTTRIAPPLRDDIIRRVKTSFAIKHAK